MRKPASERSGSDDPSRTGRGRRGVSRTGGRLFGGAHRARRWRGICSRAISLSPVTPAIATFSAWIWFRDLIVGDFDSAPQPPVLHEHTIVLPHVKDDTDTHFAARWLWQQGCRHVTFLGALGGKRLEHTIANLHTALFLAKQGVEVFAGGCVQRTAHSLPGHGRWFWSGQSGPTCRSSRWTAL